MNNSDSPNDDRSALTEEVARLRGELARIKVGRVWRHGMHLQRLFSLIAQPRLMIGRRVSFRPLLNVEQGEHEQHRQTFRLFGIDPQLSVQTHSRLPLPPGQYELQLEIFAHPDGWPSEMDLYADTGSGFTENERIKLSLRQDKRGRYFGRFALPWVTENLRLDPTEQEGVMVLGRGAIRQLSRLEYYARALYALIQESQKTGIATRTIVGGGLRRWKSGGIKAVAARLRQQSSGTSSSYANWIARYDTLTPAKINQLRASVASLPERPLIAVLMPVYNTPEHLLREAIESVRDQVYDNWELCIADDFSSEPNVRRILDEYTHLDARIRVVYRNENGHISSASNSALELVTAEWVALLDHDDVLRPHALAEVALELAAHPDAQLIYSDEDKITLGGERFDPNFKPDFSRELFRAQNYLNHLTVHRTANIRDVGGWRTGFEGSQDYDLNLRVFEKVGASAIRHIPKVLYHWRAVPGSTALAQGQKSYAFSAGFRALEEHVQRLGLAANVRAVDDLPFYRLRFAVPTPAPSVTLVIPTRDGLDVLRRAVESIIERTDYPSYDILVVDNGSVLPDTKEYLAGINDLPNVTVIPYDRPFNYSEINNFAVQQASGDIIGLVNNDVEVIGREWLSEMVSWSIQTSVGCVGAKLFYPNNTIQHAGVVLGVGGIANHAFLGESRNSTGYFGRSSVHCNVSAVTAACLVVRKDVFLSLGGLDPGLPVAFNDVDFCLRVREAGFVNVWTPFAELYHHESRSRGKDDTPEKQERFAAEIAYMVRRWGKLLENDPYYSPNFSKAMPAYSFQS